MVADLSSLIPVIATALIGAVGFLIRGYMSSLDKRIESLQAMYHRRDGQLDALLRDLRRSNEELVKVRYEVKAVWRFIDNAHKRASDPGERYG